MSAAMLVRQESRRGFALLIALVAMLAATLVGGGVPRADLQPVADLIEVVVQGRSIEATRHAVDRAGGQVTTDLPIVDGVVAHLPAESVDLLQADPAVWAVTPNAPLQVHGITPPHEATALYTKITGARQLWNEGIDGSGTTVAVIDSGIAPVPDLAGRIIGGVDFTTELNPYQDSFGHGTFVAGIVAGDGTSSLGQYKGMAPDANLLSVKIAAGNGATDMVQLLTALQWVVTMKPLYGIDVVNLSVGSDSAQPYALSPLNRAVEEAWMAGIVVVVSASNLGELGAGTITKPADDPFVITVGAIDDMGTNGRGDDRMAGFSGKGPTAADGIEKPEVVASGRSLVSLRAPGSFIDQTYPTSRVGVSYFKGSGTSQAAPVVAGAAALLLEREPGLNPDQVKARLMNTAVPVNGGGPNVSGAGSINVRAAAHAGTFGEANQDIPLSLGIGSIEADRGSLSVEIDTTVVGSLYDSEWNTEPTGSNWWGSNWWGSNWWGSNWWGSNWWGSNWWGGWE